VLQVANTREPNSDEAGPRQASLTAVGSIQPSIPMARLKSDQALSSWWLVRYNMQGILRTQEKSLTSDAEWQSFIRLLVSIDPKLAVTFGPVSSGSDAQPVDDSRKVSVKDENLPAIQLEVTGGLGAVLARAATINDTRDFDLTFSSLLLALLYGDDALSKWLKDYFDEQHIRVEHVLTRVRKDVDRAQASAKTGTADQQAILTRKIPLQRTISARRALDEAARIASDQGCKAIDVPHLVAALISLTDYHEEDFGALTLDRPRWGYAFVQYMSRQTVDASDVAFWRRFYRRRFPGNALPPEEAVERPVHRPDYDADAYTSRDLLSIEDEVSALAYVIAAKQTRPPMAIGLFGEWGSGKTFFMKHLRQRIDLLSEGARGQAVDARDCHGHIAQIEFNAWHYQEGDLWASLVDHILRNLRFGEDEEESKLAERRDQIVRDLAATEGREKAAADQAAQANAKISDVEKRAATLKEEEQTRREELARQLTTGHLLAAARAAISVDADLTKKAQELTDTIGVPAAQQSAVDLQNALSNARTELDSAWAFLLPLYRANDRGRRLMLLGVAIAVPLAMGIAISVLLSQHELLSKVASWITGLGTLMATASVWIRKQTDWIRPLRKRIQDVAAAVDQQINDKIEAALVDQKKAVADTLAELERLRRQQAEVQKEREQAAAQAQALKGRLAILGDDALMRSFLDDRISGGAYQQKLGTAALVRRDFERLSRKIEQVTLREATNTLKAGELVINRIVLYIDDLDRCEMDKVVPVLRAVHMLLAFPAFVVVVGVDSRWVARCLTKHHPGIFLDDTGNADRAVTPLDYLEKIFQIPIWLEPVPQDRRVYMVRELLRKPVTAPAPNQLPLPNADAQSVATSPSDGTSNVEASEAKTELGTAAKLPEERPKPEPGAKAPHLAHIDLNPQGLSITDGEYEFLGRMGELLSASPRTIKRFVNTYRLINVSLKQAGFKDSSLMPLDSEVRMLLLAVLVGMPALSRRLQHALRNPNGNNPALMPLIELMDAVHDGKGVADAAVSDQAAFENAVTDNALAEWEIVKRWLTERDGPWRAMPASRVAEWLDPVGRYTFNLTRAVTIARVVTEGRDTRSMA
jgi:hypothetical protein